MINIRSFKISRYVHFFFVHNIFHYNRHYIKNIFICTHSLDPDGHIGIDRFVVSKISNTTFKIIMKIFIYLLPVIFYLLTYL